MECPSFIHYLLMDIPSIVTGLYIPEKLKKFQITYVQIKYFVL